MNSSASTARSAMPHPLVVDPPARIPWLLRPMIWIAHRITGKDPLPARLLLSATRGLATWTRTPRDRRRVSAVVELSGSALIGSPPVSVRGASCAGGISRRACSLGERGRFGPRCRRATANHRTAGERARPRRDPSRPTRPSGGANPQRATQDSNLRRSAPESEGAHQDAAQRGAREGLGSWDLGEVIADLIHVAARVSSRSATASRGGASALQRVKRQPRIRR